MDFRPGDILILPDTSKPVHYVYGLIDENGKAFYIGKTCDPYMRLRAHVNQTSNARLAAKLKAVPEARMLILSEPDTESEAVQLESSLISETPGLVNQEHRSDYRKKHGKSPLIQKFRRTASKG